MPITKSAQKSLRVALRRRKENVRVRKLLKEALHKASGPRLPETFSAIDKAVKTGVIHGHKAARLKSVLSKKFRVQSSGQKRRPHRASHPAKRSKNK